MDATLLIFYLSALAGLILTVGSLFLLWKRTIVLDAKGEVSEIKLPFGVNLKTQFPVLVMFLLGAFLLYVPQYYKANACKKPADHEVKPPVHLVGEVDSDEDVAVYAIIAAQSANSDVSIALEIPCITNRQYQILYRNDKLDFRKLKSFTLSKCDEPVKLDKVIAPREVMAANADGVSLAPAQTVPLSVESNYK
jgi:hypothetical protein